MGPMEVEQIKDEICELRNELDQLVVINNHQLTNESILKVSIKLDKLISKYIDMVQI